MKVKQKLLDTVRPFTGSSFRKDESGAATVFGLYMVMVGMVVLGIALDRTNGWRVRTQLQVASDAAALAAAANLDDLDVATHIAMETARRNLPDDLSLTENDIVFGSLDPDTLEFVAQVDEEGDYTAVVALAGRTIERGNSVPTLLMQTIGLDSLDVNAGSIAVASSGGSFEQPATCHDALFLSTSSVDTGGGNEFEGAVCIHGANSVRTGGGDRFNELVRFTAESESDIILNTYSPDTLGREDLVGERTLEPSLLPFLSVMRDSIWDDLWISEDDDPSLWGRPEGSSIDVGSYELLAVDYSGTLPEFVFDSDGIARVEMRDSFWTVQPGELQEHTIYLSEQSMQFAGGVDIENAAFVSQGNIGSGGGPGLKFDDTYFIGTDLNFSGSTTWGAPTDPCDVDYGIYAFGTSSLTLGGWFSGSTVSGMVGAAPRFQPGGGMTGTGVYFETDSFLSLGGNYDLFGCENPRESDFELSDPTVEGEPVLTSSRLYR